MITEMYTQDVNSHDHVALVRPTWEGICQLMGEPTTTLRAEVLEAYEQAVDQFNYFEDVRIEALISAEWPRLAA